MDITVFSRQILEGNLENEAGCKIKGPSTWDGEKKCLWRGTKEAWGSAGFTIPKQFQLFPIVKAGVLKCD